MKFPISSTQDNHKKKKTKTSSLSSQDKKFLYRILIKRGLHPEKVKERIRNLEKEQIKIERKMRKKVDPKKELKQKQDKMVRELLNADSK